MSKLKSMLMQGPTNCKQATSPFGQVRGKFTCPRARVAPFIQFRPRICVLMWSFNLIPLTFSELLHGYSSKYICFLKRQWFESAEGRLSDDLSKGSQVQSVT